jgi:hypothetical protein
MPDNEENPELHYDFRGYLAQKAEVAGCVILGERYAVGADSVTFVLVSKDDPPRRSKVSISGLEEIQNASRDAIQNLLDGRFAKALAEISGFVAKPEWVEQTYPIVHAAPLQGD